MNSVEMHPSEKLETSSRLQCLSSHLFPDTTPLGCFQSKHYSQLGTIYTALITKAQNCASYRNAPATGKMI